MSRSYRFVIGQAETGLRLDRYLVRRLPESMSRRMIQRGVEDGRVHLNDRAAKAHAKLHPGDVITAVFPELGARGGDAALAPQPIPLDVVYEDAFLLVVNKPAGVVTHPAPGHWDGTLVNAILWHLAQGLGFRGEGNYPQPPTPNPERSLPRAGIVHRLDKDTSGLLLVAKTQQAHVALSRQLKARAIHRRYLALVEGHLGLDGGTINAPIGRHATHRKVMAVRHLGGRSAVTHYHVLCRLGGWQAPRSQPQENFLPLPFPATLLDVSLDTGRTHQIRVHMAHAGHPVVGDLTYGNHPESYWRSLGIERHLLHAVGLSFQHPASKKPIALNTALPAAMASWLPQECLRRISESGIVHGAR